jgi:hypothetical protein
VSLRKGFFSVSSTVLTAMLLGMCLFISTPHSVQAVSRTWDGGGVTNNWSEDANWSGDVEPGASDIAVFDGTSTKDATIDTSISVAGIDINAGYSGTITQGVSNSVTVGSSNFDISAGAFTGSNTTIDINGNFTVSGGTFTSTTGNFTLTGTFTVSSGTFSASTGTVVADGSAGVTWDVVTSQTFNNFTVSRGSNSALALASGDSIVVTGTLALTDGSISSGTYDTRGDINLASTFDGGAANVDFGDNGVAQTFTVSGGITPVVRFDNASDATDVLAFGAAATTSISITAGFSGTVPITNAGNHALTVSSWTQAAGTYDASAQSAWDLRTLTITGGTLVAPTTVTAGGVTSTWDVNSTQTFNNFTVNRSSTLVMSANDTFIVTGTLTLTNGSITTSSGTVEARGDVSQANTFNGGSASIDFGNDLVSQTYTVNGGITPVVRFDAAADASDTLAFATAATATVNITAGFSGNVPITNAGNHTLTFSNWTQAAGTYDASAQSAWDLRTVTISGGTLIAPTTVTAGGVTSTWDINGSQTFNNFIVNRSSTLVLSANDTYIIAGTLTLTNGSLQTSTAAFDVRGNINQANTFDGGNSIIDFGDNAVSQTYTINGGSAPGIRFDSASDASDSLVFAAGATVEGTLSVTSGFSGSIPITNPSNNTLIFAQWTQAAGTYDASAQSNWTIQGFTRTGGSFTAPTTITHTGSGGTWDAPSTQTFNNVNIANGASGLIIGTSDIIYVAGTLTYTSGQVQSGGFLEALGDVNVVGDTALGTGGLRFGGSATQTLTMSAGFEGALDCDITIDKTGGQVTLATALTLNGSSQDLIIAEGTLDLNGKTLAVNGSTGTFVVQDGGVLELFGNESMTFNASNPTLSTGSTVRYTGDGDGVADTYTITTLKSTYHHLIINSTDGATDTYQLGVALDVNGNFTNTAGVVDVVTGQNYAMTVAGNWSNSGTFQARSGTVTFDGTSQTISGTTTFNNFTKSVASTATLTFPASATQTFLGTLTLAGASSSARLSLRSSTPTTLAKIDPQGSRSVQYLDVQDNDNDNATALLCATGCLNSGNNENWIFSGVTVSAISGNTTEVGGTATFTVVLNTAPTNDVTIPISSNDTTEGTISISNLVFTNLDWSTPQTVTVTGVNDFVDDGDIGYQILLSTTTSADVIYNGLDPDDVSVTNTDNDTSGVTVSAISGDTTEAGGTATFTLVLDSQPTGNVVIQSASNTSAEGTVTGNATVTFTTLNWSAPQTVTVTGVNDDIDDGDTVYLIVTTLNTVSTIDPLYDVVSPNDVSVTNTDNDTAGVTVSAASGNTTEAGGTATFTVVLTSQPLGDVEIDTSTTNAAEGAVTSGGVLTFTDSNWFTSQTVTITGQDDFVQDGNIAYSIAVSVNAGNTADALYDPLDPSDVNLENTDNDVAGFTVSAISGNTTEAGGTATFTLALNTEPTNDVTIPTSSNDTSEGTIVVTEVIFTALNWSTPQTVTVTGINDDVDDGDISYQIVLGAAVSGDGVYSDLDPSDVSAVNADNDTSGITVSLISGDTTEAGGTATFTLVLNTQPTGDVIITSAPDNASEGTVTGNSSVTFTALNWSAPQTVTVTGANDDIDDDDTDYSIITTLDTGATADGIYDGLNPADVSVTNLDDDTAGVTVSAISGNTTEAGGTATYSVVLDTQPTGDVIVASVTNDATEGTVTSTASLTFTTLNWSTPQTVTVTGVNDDVDDGNIDYSLVVSMNELLTLDSLFDAIDPTDVNATNTDDDTAGVTVSLISGNTTEAGGTANFTLVLDSQPTGNVNLETNSTDSTEGTVTDGASLIFTTLNWSTPQTVTVTGADDFIQDGDIDYSMAVTTDTGDTADGLYDAIDPGDVAVTNTDNDVIGFTLSAISGDTTEAGDTATFTAVLNTIPTDDVTIPTASSNTSEGTLAITQLVFTSANWSTPQTVTVTGVDDVDDDDDVTYQIILGVATSLDLDYAGLNPSDITVLNIDNDEPSSSGGGGVGRPRDTDTDTDPEPTPVTPPTPTPVTPPVIPVVPPAPSPTTPAPTPDSSSGGGGSGGGGASGVRDVVNNSGSGSSADDQDSDSEASQWPVGVVLLAGDNLVLSDNTGQVTVLPETLTTIEVTVPTDQAINNIVIDVDGDEYILKPTQKPNVYTGVVPTAQVDQIWSTRVNLVTGDTLTVPLTVDIKQPGLVYELIDDQKTPISNASVSLRSATGDLWDANGFSQSNPFITSGDGSFSWYLPNGTYSVLASKDGYQERSVTVQVTNNILTTEIELVPLRMPEFVSLPTGITLPTVALVTKGGLPIIIATSFGAFGLLTASFQLLPYLQYLFTSPFLMLSRKRRRAFGVVYNSMTKVPVDLAIVRLYSIPDNVLVKTTITDFGGRYFILAAPGKYRLEVSKSQFTSPSTYLNSQANDGPYLDVYQGQSLTITDARANVTVSIPIDPIVVDSPHIVRRFRTRKLITFVQWALGLSGLGLAIAVAIVTPSVVTIVLAGMQLVIMALVWRLARPKRPKGWGVVYDQRTKQPLRQAIIRLFEPKYNKLIDTTITDSRGRYSFLLGPSYYYATYTKDGYQEEMVQPIDTTQLKEPAPYTQNVGLLKRNP